MADPRDTALASLICERNDHPDAPACDGCYAMAAWLREHGYERATVPAPVTCSGLHGPECTCGARVHGTAHNTDCPRRSVVGAWLQGLQHAQEAHEVPAPVTPDLRAALADIIRRIARSDGDWPHLTPESIADYLIAAGVTLSDRDAEPVSRDPLRLDPDPDRECAECPRPVPHVHCAYTYSDGVGCGCVEDDHPSSILHAFKRPAPDPTEDTPNG